MNRTMAREMAFKILFQVDVGKNIWQEALARALSETEGLSEPTRRFVENLVEGTLQHQKAIDEYISKFAREWSLERMANTDRNILRMALYELTFMKEIPPSVTVNEAVELAKRYGDAESGKFVNGILGEMIRSSHTQAP